jgi:hypothetical protein
MVMHEPLLVSRGGSNYCGIQPTGCSMNSGKTASTRKSMQNHCDAKS